MKFFDRSIHHFLGLLLLLGFITACQQEPVELDPTAEPTEVPAPDTPPEPRETLMPATSTPLPTPTEIPEVTDPNPKTILISHIQAGVQGNNNQDFIALYNNSGSDVDLKGYKLIYQARPDADLQELYRWRTFTPFTSGFYILQREGEEFPFTADGFFDIQLFNRGSLALVGADGDTVDLVGWGEMPEGAFIGQPAPKIPRGQTLVRKLEPPFDGDSNLDSFALMQNPEVIGCRSADLPISIEIPTSVTPGSDFTITVQVQDTDAVEALSILIPPGFTAGDGEPSNKAIYQEFVGPLTGTQIITLRAPLTLQSSVFRGSKAIVNGESVCIPSRPLVVEGVLPIEIARTFVNQTITIEGIATMYTDGFYAGSSGTKFYIEDDSGGVQVYVPGGKGGVTIELGDRVRVTGKTEYYRTSLEVIPADYSAQIEVIEKAAETSHQPKVATINQASGDAALIGDLLAVSGTITRVEEFNYSYEIDLVDETGDKLPVYIDKLTNVSVLAFEEGQEVTISGILESWDGNIRLNPRVQTDLARIWPETLLIEAIAPAAVSVSPIEVQFNILNNTSETQTNLQVISPQPEGTIETVILDQGITATREQINWLIPQLEPGQSVTLNMIIELSEPDQDSGTDEQILVFPIEVTSDQIQEPQLSAGKTVFTGGMLPIWAIQGSGDKSPYVGLTETTSGIVTGIFPELGGMFIQSQSGDQNISTSDAVFINFGDSTIPNTLTTGMQVTVKGTISENGGQTALEVESSDDISIISTIDLFDAFNPVQLIPPSNGEILDYFEAREGMLVTLDGYAVAVGPTNRFGEFPLFPLSMAGNLSPNAPILFRNPTSNLDDAIIYVDDGSEAEYEMGEELPLSVNTGDIVSGLVGPLAFTYGNFKIEPISPADIIVEPSTYAEKALPIPEARPASQYAIATFNVENLFDILEPHPSSPPAPSRDEYRRKLAKLAAGFELMGYPEIVGLQEVENDKVLRDLAEAIVEIGGPVYDGHLLEGSDSRGIDVAYMTRADRVTPILLEQRPDPDGTLSREPLVLQATIDVDGGAQEVIVINNHFTSLAGGEEATLPRRTAQAAWNRQIVADFLAENPEANIVVLGDLNSFRETDPLDTLEENLWHIYDKLEGRSSIYPIYTYIFQGVAQSLDHILVSTPLYKQLVNVIALPISADYPLQAADDLSPYRASDHNPLIAVFEVGE